MGASTRINFLDLGPRPAVDMLIGTDYAELHYSIKKMCGQPGELVVRLTPLGLTYPFVGWKSSRTTADWTKQSLESPLIGGCYHTTKAMLMAGISSHCLKKC